MTLPPLWEGGTGWRWNVKPREFFPESCESFAIAGHSNSLEKTYD